MAKKNVVKEKYSVYTPKQEVGYTAEIKVHQERNHLVVPVTMMVEGVHSGSAGPLLHLIADLGRFPESWNGMPVMIDHPAVNGQNVSANSPDIIDTSCVGRIYNTNVSGTKLRGEAWLDEEKLRQINPVTLTHVNEAKPIEVSIGVFTEEEVETGDWNGETYEAIAKNHRPDHLALLPGGTGACSIEDGCGIRANNKKGGIDVKHDEWIKTMRSLNEEGFSIMTIGDHSAQGYKELVDSIRKKLDGMDTNDSYYMLEEVYEDSLIYAVHFRVGESKMYKQEYQFNSGKIELMGNPVEVRKNVEYVANTLQRTKFSVNNKKEDKTMTKNECPKCAEKINALIANKESGFVESDREWLEALTETALDKVAPKVIEKEVIVEKTIEVNKLAPEDQAALAYGRKQLAERRAMLTKGIQDNTKGIWSDEKLKSMDDETLESVYASVKKEDVVSYVGNGTGFHTDAEGEEPLYPAGIEIETVK